VPYHRIKIDRAHRTIKRLIACSRLVWLRAWCEDGPMPEAWDLKVHVAYHEQGVVISVRGELDYEDAELLEAAWQTADHSGLSTTAVDLTQVTFADSMLLNALLDAHRRHHADDRELVLLGPLQPPIRRLLELSGTLEHFTIKETGGF
jgi:anti-anti-sigma factor